VWFPPPLPAHAVKRVRLVWSAQLSVCRLGACREELAARRVPRGTNRLGGLPGTTHHAAERLSSSSSTTFFLGATLALVAIATTFTAVCSGAAQAGVSTSVPSNFVMTRLTAAKQRDAPCGTGWCGRQR
jgi:hypothetical protein